MIVSICTTYRRGDIAFGISTSGNSTNVLVALEKAKQQGGRRDLSKYVHTLDKGDMLAAAERLRSFDRPALVVWAPEYRVMPPAHGRRFAELLPHGRLVEIADSYTLIPEDQPGELARAIRQSVRDTP